VESPVAGYSAQKIEGFQVFISSEVSSHKSDTQFAVGPMDVLKGELATAAKALPTWTLNPLRKTVPIWAKWQDTPIRT
jgi:hypothetical protein